MKIKLIDKLKAYYNRDTVRKLNIATDDIVDFAGVEWIGRGAMHEFIMTGARLVNMPENVKKMYEIVKEKERRKNGEKSNSKISI